jgi:two-component system chemotaxis response regulator CheY
MTNRPCAARAQRPQQLGFKTIHGAPTARKACARCCPAVQRVATTTCLLDGLGLLRAIRSHPPISKTAYIMLTGRADRGWQRAVQFGVNNLVKPFTVGP